MIFSTNNTTKTPSIRRLTNTVLAAALGFVLSGCAGTTLITSDPPGASLYLNGEKVGVTPYTHTDRKIIGSTNLVTLKKEGYVDLNTSFSRNEELDIGAVIGGVVFLVPFLWTMEYKPSHSYELSPLKPNQ